MIKLRDYQETDIARIRASLAKHKRVVYVLPTGGGKTVIFAHIAERLASQGKRVLILAHRKNLVRQIEAALAAMGVNNITVNTTQSEARRKKAGEYHLIIVDEAHHACSESFRSTIYLLNPKFCLGVTATPERLDGIGLGIVFADIVQGATTRELIDKKYLAEYRYFVPPNVFDKLSGAKMAKEATDKHKDEVMARKERYGYAVDLYRKHMDGKQALAFCYSVADAKNTAEQFAAAGIDATYVSGDQPDDVVAAKLAAYARGEYLVLCSCDLIGEGLDVPDTVGIIMMRATSSMVVFRQQIGRALRPKSDGGKAIIIDMVDNASRHGRPCDVKIWSLASKDKKRTREADAIDAGRRCESCFYVNKMSAKICSECGATLPVRVIEYREVKTSEDFVELGARDSNAYRQEEIMLLVERAQTIGDMQNIARHYRLNDDWAQWMHAAYCEGGYTIGQGDLLPPIDNDKTDLPCPKCKTHTLRHVVYNKFNCSGCGERYVVGVSA